MPSHFWGTFMNCPSEPALQGKGLGAERSWKGQLSCRARCMGRDCVDSKMWSSRPPSRRKTPGSSFKLPQEPAAASKGLPCSSDHGPQGGPSCMSQQNAPVCPLQPHP